MFFYPRGGAKGGQGGSRGVKGVRGVLDISHNVLRLPKNFSKYFHGTVTTITCILVESRCARNTPLCFTLTRVQLESSTEFSFSTSFLTRGETGVSKYYEISLSFALAWWW